MNQIKCYKLVLRTPNDTLVSLYAEWLPPGWTVQYAVGKPASPYTGELFAFDTEESARSHQRVADCYEAELHEALTKAPARPIDSVCYLGASHGSFSDFWNPPAPSHITLPAPPGTITTRSLTLVKRLP